MSKPFANEPNEDEDSTAVNPAAEGTTADEPQDGETRDAAASTADSASQGDVDALDAAESDDKPPASEDDTEERDEPKEPVDKRFFKTKTAIFFALVTLLAVFACMVIALPMSNISINVSTVFGIAHLLAFSSLAARIGFLITAIVLIPALVALVRTRLRGTHRQSIIMALAASVALGASSTLLYLNPTASIHEQHLATPVPLWSAHDFSSLDGEDLNDFLTPNVINTPVDDPDAIRPPKAINIAEFNSFNTLSPADLEELMRYEPAVIVLPETTNEAVTTALAALPKELNGRPVHDYQVFSSASFGAIAPVTVLVSDVMGPYKETTVEEDMVGFGTVKLIPENKERVGLWPTIIGIHNAPPLPSLMSQWKEDTDKVLQLGDCANAGDSFRIIVAGDLNATLRHGSLAIMHGCWDTMDLVGKGNMGTWPASMRPEFAAPIDHVIIHGTMDPRIGRVINLGDSDHRAIITQVHMGKQ